MYGDPPLSQIIHAQDTTNHVSSEVVEDQNFPYRFAVGVEYWCGMCRESIRKNAILMSLGGLHRCLIEVEDLLDGAFIFLFSRLAKGPSMPQC